MVCCTACGVLNFPCGLDNAGFVLLGRAWVAFDSANGDRRALSSAGEPLKADGGQKSSEHDKDISSGFFDIVTVL